ncbi:MAG: T9SS type A sorting domain-containing protein, partial [Bacteroidales bacterium]|nr:T9SS type A sorting domain-containing protein [Bacteroidales bacterium]
ALAGKAAFTLKNQVGKDISEVTFSIQTSWGNTEYTYQADSILKAGESVRVITDAFAARTNGEETVEIKVKSVNGETYPADATSTVTATLFVNYAFTHNADVTLNVVQDRYGEDITWKFRDTDKDTVLFTGGPYKELSANRTSVNSVPMNLEKGCYVLTVYDKSGDGINSKFGAGNINFVSQGQEFYRHDGKYADSVIIMLDTRENAANGKTEKAEKLTLRPNPAKDRAEISFTAEKTALVRVQVLNHTGACVLDLGNVRTEAGNTRIELPLQNLVPGLYFVTLRGENVNLSSKLVIVR